MNQKQLRNDVYSAMKSSRMYGKAGDRITIVSERGNVFIVEGEDGQRFPLTADEVCDEGAQPAAVQLPKIKIGLPPVKAASKPKAKQPVKKQPKLF